MSLSCRFYADEYPNVEETVVAKVYKITEMGAYVTLSEYNNKGFQDFILPASFLIIDSNFRRHDTAC